MSDGAPPYSPTGMDAPPPGFGPPASEEWPGSRDRSGPGRGRGGAGRTRRRRLVWLAQLVTIVAVFVVGGPFLFFHFVEGRSPGRLALPAAGGVKGRPLLAGPLSGTWAVSAGSQAGYRVQEVLFGTHHTAVGRTPKISGGLVISATTVTAADFRVDMASVRSDQPGRDAEFAGYIMQTYNHPYATFRLTRPIRLGVIPPPGTVVTEQATGRLGLRGEHRVVSFALHAERVGAGIDVNASIPITFSVWHIPLPKLVVAQVGKTGTIEVLLHLMRATH
ncbi:MAG: YceI family protein [Acidimicrobiales bacterium]